MSHIDDDTGSHIPVAMWLVALALSLLVTYFIVPHLPQYLRLL